MGNWVSFGVELRPLHGLSVSRLLAWNLLRIERVTTGADCSLFVRGDPGVEPDALPRCVTFMPKTWCGLEVLVPAEKATRQPQPAVT